MREVLNIDDGVQVKKYVHAYLIRKDNLYYLLIKLITASI